MLKIIDLCCGVGGFSLAFKDIAKPVFACDWDEKARLTYDTNFPGHKLVSNIHDIVINDIPKYDILCAGFPCQPFSIAGSQEGFDHETQGNIFFRVCEIIKETSPKVIFLENVKNLVSHDSGKTFNVILKSLEDIGYKVKSQILNATEYGNLPQNRERIYIVGFLDKKHYNKFDFPDKIDLTKKLFGDIINISKKQDDKLYQTNTESPSVQKMFEGIKKQNVIYQYRRFVIRENKSGECPTLTANMGSGGHNVPLILDNFGIRKLSVEECFHLQGFPVPKEFKLPNISNSHLYHQVGNSIPVPVVERIARKIGEVL